MTRIRKGLAVGRRSFYRADLVGDVHLYVCGVLAGISGTCPLHCSTVQFSTVLRVQYNKSAQLQSSK